MSTALDRRATPDRLRRLRAAGVLDGDGLAAALAVALATPPAAAWRRFLDRLMLAVGTVLTLSGVVAFFAYNWASLGRLSRVGLVEVLLVAAGGAALAIGLDRLGGQLAATAATALAGVLLAMIGQAYQQGADPWQLFALTAALGLPWLLATRFAPLWLFELALANLALVLWWSARIEADDAWSGRRFASMLLSLGALNGGAWLSWTFGAAAAGLRAGRWLPRIVALAAMAALAVGAAGFVVFDVLRFDPEPSLRFGAPGLAVFVAWLGVTGAIVVLCRRRWPDLFLLALAALGGIVVVSAAVFRWLVEADDLGGRWLVMALVLVVEAALAAVWLRRSQLAMAADADAEGEP